MNPEFRKVALIAASLGLLVSLFLALRGDEDEQAATTDVPTTTAPAPTGRTEASPRRPDLELRLRGGAAVGGIGRATVDRGTVTIRIVSDTRGELHVHGYDLRFTIEASGTTEIEFEATTPGIFEIELEGTHTLIAELEVRP